MVISKRFLKANNQVSTRIPFILAVMQSEFESQIHKHVRAHLQLEVAESDGTREKTFC